MAGRVRHYNPRVFGACGKSCHRYPDTRGFSGTRVYFGIPASLSFSNIFRKPFKSHIRRTYLTKHNINIQRRVHHYESLGSFRSLRVMASRVPRYPGTRGFSDTRRYLTSPVHYPSTISLENPFKAQMPLRIVHTYLAHTINSYWPNKSSQYLRLIRPRVFLCAA